MRLHTNLSQGDVRDALHKAKSAGQVPGHVFLSVGFHGSRSHLRAFEIKLSASQKQPGDKRRKTNSGAYGAGDEWAAKWDEWGWFMSYVFDADPEAKFGPYNGVEDFHRQTKGAFVALVAA